MYCCFVSLTRLTFKLQDQRQFEVNNVIVLAIERKRIRHFSFTFVFKISSPNLPPSWTVADHISPRLASRLVWTVNSPHLLQILTFIMPSLTSEEITFFVNGKKVGNLSNLPASIDLRLFDPSIFSLYTYPKKQISEVIIFFLFFFLGNREKTSTWNDGTWISSKPLYPLI